MFAGFIFQSLKLIFFFLHTLSLSAAKLEKLALAHLATFFSWFICHINNFIFFSPHQVLVALLRTIQWIYHDLHDLAALSPCLSAGCTYWTAPVEIYISPFSLSHRIYKTFIVPGLSLFFIFFLPSVSLCTCRSIVCPSLCFSVFPSSSLQYSYTLSAIS